MKKSTFTFVTMLCVSVWLGNAFAQNTAKPAAKPSAKELALQKAEANQARIEKKIANADSLIAVHGKDFKEAQEAIENNNDQRKVLDKEYAQKRKVLEKKSVSKDKSVAAEAKAEMKALDVEYKTSVKQSDTELKQNMKKSDTANKILTKAELDKKNGTKELKEAKKVVATAQKAMNVPEPKGKKK